MMLVMHGRIDMLRCLYIGSGSGRAGDMSRWWYGAGGGSCVEELEVVLRLWWLTLKLTK